MLTLVYTFHPDIYSKRLRSTFISTLIIFGIFVSVLLFSKQKTTIVPASLFIGLIMTCDLVFRRLNWVRCALKEIVVRGSDVVITYYDMDKEKTLIIPKRDLRIRKQNTFSKSRNIILTFYSKEEKVLTIYESAHDNNEGDQLLKVYNSLKANQTSA